VRRTAPTVLAGCASLVSILCPSFALAGPPFLTDDPEPTDTGHWEIYAPALQAAGAGAGSNGLIFAELNYGPVQNVQLTLDLPVAFASDPSGSRAGPGDVALSVKYRFYHDEASGVSIAAFPGLTVPTATDGLGSGRLTAFLPVWAERDVGPWSVFGGGGYAINPGLGNRDYWRGGIAATRTFGKRLLLGVEADRQGADTDDGRASTSLGAGAILRLDPPFRLLASGGPTFVDGERTAGFHVYVALGLDF
jgi:hypothetical protein